MQLVPLIPQPKIGIEKRHDVAGVSALKLTRPVKERTLPPLIIYRHAQTEKISAKERESRKAQVERRSLCRRLHPQNILEELRSSLDRRKQQQKNTDYRFHIDIEI